MKLLVVTCVHESKRDVIQLLHKSGISIFSLTDITGFKDGEPIDLQESWFSAGREQFESLLFFSFCDEGRTQTALENIKAYNATHEDGFPLRGFKLAVEDATFTS